MERQGLMVYSAASNLAVIEVPGRRFPGSVIQGDSLMILCNLAGSVHRRAVQTADQELIDEAGELLELLQERLRHYEATLEQHGIELPCPRPSQE
jgi:hypothetical protein